MEKTVKKEQIYDNGFIYEQGESGKWKCPVCGNYCLNKPDTWGYCPICDAPNNDPFFCGITTETKVSFKEAQRQWRKWKRVDWGY